MPDWSEDLQDVRRCLAGDQEAFSSIVQRHQSLLRSHAAAIAGASDADDIAQDAFIRAWHALGRYDERFPMRSWLLVIATRLAINRAARRRHFAPMDADSDLAGPAPVRDETAIDRVELLEQALAELSPMDRSLFELRYRQDVQGADLADALGITTGALKVRLHRLRRRLAQRLGLHTSEEDDHG